MCEGERERERERFTQIDIETIQSVDPLMDDTKGQRMRKQPQHKSFSLFSIFFFHTFILLFFSGLFPLVSLLFGSSLFLKWQPCHFPVMANALLCEYTLMFS